MKQISILIIALCIAIPAYALSGKTLRTVPEWQVNTPPMAATTYDRGCNGEGKPRNLATTSTPSVSGVVTTTTINETDGTNTWVTTSTYNSTTGAVTYTCAQIQ